MVWRDLLLAAGTLPLVLVVMVKLAAAAGTGISAPSPDALPAALIAFAVTFLLYVCLTVRAIARETNVILERGLGDLASRATRRPPAVSDFAVHIDHRREVDFEADAEAPRQPTAARSTSSQRADLLGDVRQRLARIPSVRRGP